ncbi:anti-anti-sigma factor [Mycobacterium sp. 852013-51886_SCH5428379]|uniref:STAS domain-containing protein n=1 Tax=Mycobacterium sp. 852013-51886_SCH5428379 TaxID=1834111 RepID=UPI0008018DCE|nr:STAS domain-containing protein [Mycobacterium sp. 852013-51886_SCH5428379]OBB62195.1 anti-anti-sigma factor [Mycobacterium sp. 852013-51886_SCH5428379]
MTRTSTRTRTSQASDAAFHYGNPAFDCHGVRMRARCRQLATVVTVSGDIDSTNVDCVAEYAKRFVLAEKPFVLDLSGVNSFAAEALSMFYDLDEQCAAAEVEWSVVGSQPVLQAMRSSAGLDAMPVTNSVPEALHHFSEGILARRRLLPLLTKTA